MDMSAHNIISSYAYHAYGRRIVRVIARYVNPESYVVIVRSLNKVILEHHFTDNRQDAVNLYDKKVNHDYDSRIMIPYSLDGNVVNVRGGINHLNFLRRQIVQFNPDGLMLVSNIEQYSNARNQPSYIFRANFESVRFARSGLNKFVGKLHRSPNYSRSKDA